MVYNFIEDLHDILKYLSKSQYKLSDKYNFHYC